MIKPLINKHELKLQSLLPLYFKEPFTPEFRFCDRRWRFDFANKELMIAFEVEGGTWTGGRHVNPIGYAKDCEKYNMAARLGWKVYRLVPSMISKEYLDELIAGKASLTDDNL